MAGEGHETHGGGGIIIDPDGLSTGKETPGSVEVFDKLEYDNEFLAQDQDEYRSYIAPKIDTLKTKLPRTGAFLEQVFIRGISPRWYFVRYGLKRIHDPSETSHLFLSSRRVQIAANDGIKIQIQKTLYDSLEPKSRSYLLMHEGIRSAIGLDFSQTSDQVKSIASLILNKNLDFFSAADIAKELLATLASSEDKGKKSPFFNLVFADSHFQQKEIAGWEDISVLEDGITPTSCSFQTDRCAFRDTERGLIWTMASPNKARGALLNYDQAVLSCKDFSGYAGYYSWKLPTFSEFKDVVARFGKLVESFPAFGNNNAAFWSASSPDTDPWSTFFSLSPLDPLKGWAVNLATSQVREVNRSAEIPYVCVVDHFTGWTEASTDMTGKTLQSCTGPGSQCAYKDNHSGLVWSSPGPQYTPRYQGRRRSEDSGFVSQQVAVGSCESLKWAGLSDWRLPTERELADAKRDGLIGVSIAHEFFGNLRGDFWFDASSSADKATLSLGAKDASDSTPAGLARYVCVHDEVK